jgi:hypothetical protein
VLKASIVSSVFVLATLVARPAFPCMNEVMRQEEAIKMMVEAEKLIDSGDYKKAEVRLQKRYMLRDEQLVNRATDLSFLISLRTHKIEKESLKYAVEHFENRAKKNKDVKFKAWLAEAYEAAGKTEQAMQILVDLKKKDLMPDAFAYATLARLSSGADRDAALESCKSRTKVKSICTLPAAGKAAPAEANAKASAS